MPHSVRGIPFPLCQEIDFDHKSETLPRSIQIRRRGCRKQLQAAAAALEISYRPGNEFDRPPPKFGLSNSELDPAVAVPLSAGGL